MESAITKEQVEKGHSVYSRRVLGIYDLLVFGVSTRLLWRCPTHRFIDHYNRHVTTNHLDVGVGTGYLLDNCRLRDEQARVGLMDLNVDCLHSAGERLSRHNIEKYTHNVLEPFNNPIEKFDSIGLFNLIHCVPGNLQEKGCLFSHLKSLLNDNGVIFGSTVLGLKDTESKFTKLMMRLYSKKGVFNNLADTAEDLERELSKRFNRAEVSVVGNVALFYATDKSA
ncbi:MAG: class I SAM-dependent methyltransferase [Ketobacteraceae bacterium]|nr:class I SAM-dependent methyltransferase [Ketobacteraceae bacterium]